MTNAFGEVPVRHTVNAQILPQQKKISKKLLKKEDLVTGKNFGTPMEQNLINSYGI